MLYRHRQVLFFLTLLFTATTVAADFEWPLRCPDGSERQCLVSITYPDIDGDGHDASCNLASDRAHTGTDLVPTEHAVSEGVAVIAAASGTVIYTQGDLFDQCPADHPECLPASRRKIRPGFQGGYTTCTAQGNYCSENQTDCFWCFSGNYVVIEHEDSFTTYLHLKQDSLTVAPGDRVNSGDKLGLVGSSGNSDGPHLHFEIWAGGLFRPVDPWSGDCGATNAVWIR